jgi:5'-deoxynucleotidase YfbR-like HD superfamily hydrolase
MASTRSLTIAWPAAGKAPMRKSDLTNSPSRPAGNAHRAGEVLRGSGAGKQTGRRRVAEDAERARIGAVRVALTPPRAARAAAIDFLLDAYEGVRVRPGKGPPHAQAVADILREVGADERTQVAALLHDVIEDTPRDIDDVRAVFGDGLATMVDALSEDPAIERYAERKRALRGSIAASSQAGVMDIALADKIATLRHAAMTGTTVSPRKLAHYRATLRLALAARVAPALTAELARLSALQSAGP